MIIVALADKEVVWDSVLLIRTKVLFQEYRVTHLVDENLLLTLI